MTKQTGATEALVLATALLENGDSLLEDAQILLDKGRPARAVALSLIAAEELGKIYLCLGGITGETDVPSATSREWRNHRDKLETAKALELAFVDHQPNLDSAKIKAEIDWQLRMKMSALYVDHNNGRTMRPSDVEADPHGLIERGRAKSAVLHGVLDRISPEVLDAMEQHGALMARIAQALIDEGDPLVTIDRLRAVNAAAVLDDEEALGIALRAALTATSPPVGQR